SFDVLPLIATSMITGSRPMARTYRRRPPATGRCAGLNPAHRAAPHAVTCAGNSPAHCTAPAHSAAPPCADPNPAQPAAPRPVRCARMGREQTTGESGHRADRPATGCSSRRGLGLAPLGAEAAVERQLDDEQRD